MKTAELTVDSFLKKVPTDRFETLNKIRQICIQELTGYHETIAYGMPGYKMGNIVEIGFANQKK